MISKNIKEKFVQLVMTAFVPSLLLLLGFTSCSDDDNGGSVNIESVWSNWYNSDNTLSESRQLHACYPDKWVALKGSGFKGTTAVYCNGYQCPVKEMNVSDDWLIFQIKYKTPPSDSITDESIRSTVRVVTDHGEATYKNFVIKDNAAVPSVTSVSNTVPKAGQIITVRGAHLDSVTAVYFPGASGDIAGTITHVGSGDVAVTVPEGSMQSGALRLVCLDENVYSPNYMFGATCKLNISATDITLGSKAKILQGADAVAAATGLSASAFDLPSMAIAIPETQSGMLLKETNYNMDAKGRYFKLSLADALEAARAAANIPQTTELKNLALQMDVYMPQDWASGSVVTRFRSTSSYTNTAANEYSAPWVVDKIDKGSLSFNGFETITIPLGNHASLVTGNVTSIQAFIDGMKGDKTVIGFSNCYFNKNNVNISSVITQFQIFIANLRLVNYVTADNSYSE